MTARNTTPFKLRCATVWEEALQQIEKIENENGA